jgi:hypothetical protein
MIYDKNNKYLPSFIINHKNTIYLVRLLWWRMCPREVFAKIARDFQMICFVF